MKKRPSKLVESENELEELKVKTGECIQRVNDLVKKIWHIQRKLAEAQNVAKPDEKEIEQLRQQLALLELEIEKGNSLVLIEYYKQKIKEIEKKLHNRAINFEEPYLFNTRNQ